MSSACPWGQELTCPEGQAALGAHPVSGVRMPLFSHGRGGFKDLVASGAFTYRRFIEDLLQRICAAHGLAPEERFSAVRRCQSPEMLN